MKISGANVLITGANRGIGWALAREFAKNGAHLLLGARVPDLKQEKELKKIGASSARILELDLGAKNSIDSFLSKQKERGQEIDILVNNAGQLTGGLFEKQNVDDIYSMFQVNLLGLVHLTRGVLPSMISRKRGKIVNNSSVSGVMHFPCASTYTAAKSGVVAFTESLRQELYGTGVSTLLLFTPGVKTRMFDQISTLYGENMELDFLSHHISPEVWAEMVCAAIHTDKERLLPKGSTGISLRIARYFPQVFEGLVAKKFHR